MTQKSKHGLFSDIDTTITDNNTGGISGPKLNTILTDIVDSTYHQGGVCNVLSPGSGLTPLYRDNTNAAGNTTALQEIVNNRAGIIYFPPGNYGITGTIVIPEKFGGPMFLGTATQGSDLSTADDMSDTFFGSSSVIRWHGTSGDGPMIWSRANGWSIDNITLNGHQDSSTYNFAGQGLRISATDNLVGVGKHQIGHLSITKCDVGMEIGYDGGPNYGNDNIVSNFLSIEKCTKGYQVWNSQAMGHIINYFRFSFPSQGPSSNATGDRIAFDFRGGGSLWLNNGLIVDDTGPCKFLELTSSGVNNGTYYIKGVQQDQQITSCQYLNDKNVTGVHKVTFEHCHAQNNVTDVKFNASGPCRLELIDWEGLTYSKLRDNIVLNGTASNRCNLLVERCPVDNAISGCIHEDSDNYEYVARNNGFSAGSTLSLQPDEYGNDTHGTVFNNWMSGAKA